MRGFYWSANSPFIQKFWPVVRRAPRAAGISTTVADGFINVTLPDGRVHRNANPAFMVYECLTNPLWGMCGPDAQMGTSFATAAQTLRDENFGLFMLWTDTDLIENFVGEILDHIQGVLYLSPSTGKWELTLLRGDYDAATLPVYSPANAQFSSYARKLPGETVNEIVAKWTNPVTEKEETVTIQDLAAIVSQGGQIVSQDRNYYGVRSPDLILTLAARDLRSVVAPLATCTMRAFRSAWATAPGQCIKVTIPDENVVEQIMRVQTVDYGDRSNGYVTVTMIADIFALDAPAYVGTAPSGQASTSLDPNPPAYVNVFTLPAYLIANSTEQFVDQPEYPEVVAGVLTGDANPDFLNVEPYTDTTLANGTVTPQSIGTRDRIGVFVTTDPLVAEAFTTFAGFPGLLGPGPRLATIVFIGSGDQGELALVQAIDSSGNYTLARGVLDTVPRAWPTGTPMWFVGTQRYIDPDLRAPGETVSYRPLMRTSVGLLAYANGVDAMLTLTDRPYLPLRPANVKVNGQGFGTVSIGLNPETYTDFNATPWSRNNVTVSGQTITVAGDGAYPLVFRSQNGKSLSVVLKAGTAGWASVFADKPAFTAAWFDLVNGVVGTDQLGGSTITPLGGGWYRCTIVDPGVGGGNVGFGVAGADASISAPPGATLLAQSATFVSPGVAAASVTWANRNRLVETGQILAWTAGNVMGEDGQTTTVRVLKADGTVLHEYAGLTGTTTTVAAADLVGGAAIQVAAVTTEGESLQSFVLPLTV